MTNQAVAIQLQGWNALRAVKWLKRAVPAALILAITALFVQPPVSSAQAVPSKADPVLFSRAAAHPSQTFPLRDRLGVHQRARHRVAGRQ